MSPAGGHFAIYPYRPRERMNSVSGMYSAAIDAGHIAVLYCGAWTLAKA